MRASGAVTINRPVDEVYRYWLEVERRSESTEVIEEVDGASIRWRSIESAPMPGTGTARFRQSLHGRGTEVYVDLEYRPPAGIAGAMVAKLVGDDPAMQLRDDLRRRKQMLETGEIAVSDASPEGATPKRLLSQRPAQPVEA